ncbi:MAG: hypothetical protein KC620_26040 [Myxococcales bacterium]|nr:hypothetical protein [Myxococcales bacterium]
MIRRARRSACLLIPFCILIGCGPSVARPGPIAPAPAAAPRIAVERLDGIALSLYFEDAARDLTYERMLDDIVAIGARHVSLTVQWAQTDVRASALAPHATETTPDATVRRVMRAARARGLSVMVFPIVWVEKRAMGEWRGTLAPTDEAAWWRSYRAFILHYAGLAAAEGADLFSVGSEFASLEDREARWRALIAEVRGVFSGALLYSANWDHYAEVPFWDALDAIGLTGYYRLSEQLDPSQAELTAAWTTIRDRLLAWRARVGRPLVFTELGYPSLDGAAYSPWDYTTGRAADPEEQRRCLAAFAAVWRDVPDLAGVFFWNAFGPRDGQNTWYTFWGKPAEAEVKAWLIHRVAQAAKN